ncbi:myophilin-like isoform X1 [Diadema setosum]|uniref:myophilin-like isoform X1 n=1 Tax=Diadema setosum TaxID=31175 RepID=UPI003B3BB930
MSASTRAAPSGLRKDMQQKRDQKYSVEDEIKVRGWIENLLGIKLKNQNTGMAPFAECLKDGQVLCNLMNHLQPGAIKKVNTQSFAFKQMENISSFLKAAEAYGVPNSSLFQTVDLYEEQDVGSVVNCLFSLAGQARKKGVNVDIGIAVQDPTKREFSEETLAAGKAVLSQQAGFTGGASQAGSGGFGNTRKL